MNYGSASAATVGYILGDVPGAYIGYKAFNALKKTYPMKYQKKKISRELHQPYHHTGSKYKKKHAPLKKRKYKKYPVKQIKHAKTLRHPGVKKLKKRSLKQRGHKRVKISKKFRLKVKKIVAGMKPRGFTIHTVFDYENVQVGLNQQTVTPMPTQLGNIGFYIDGTGYHSEAVLGLLFTPTWFLQQASILWNNYGAPNYSGGTWVNGQLANPVGGNMLPWRGTKVPVVKSWARYCIKNNTTRLAYVKVYNCKPKFRGPLVLNNNKTGGQPQDAYSDWILASRSASIADVGTQLTNVTTYINPDSTGGGAGYLTSPNTYKEDPRHNPYWSSRWTCEITKLAIEPGQCIPFIVKGPSDTVIDYNKIGPALYTQAATPGIDNSNTPVFQDIQPWVRSVFFVMNHEMCSYKSSAAWKTGLAPSLEFSSDGEGLLVETSVYTKVLCPEIVGRVNESTFQASVTQNNNLRVDRYGNFVYSYGTSDGIATTLNVNNGGVTATPSG